MKFKLKPFKEIISLSKEKLDEAMAPIRAKMMQSTADLEMAQLEGQIISQESKIMEMCTQKEINFKSLIQERDKLYILERNIKQYQAILDELFPKE